LFGVISEVVSYGNVITIYTIFAGVGLLSLLLFGKEKLAGKTSVTAERTIH
jgi:SET family sugar efflux transporter-like MFS transporter